MENETKLGIHEVEPLENELKWTRLKYLRSLYKTICEKNVETEHVQPRNFNDLLRTNFELFIAIHDWFNSRKLSQLDETRLVHAFNVE